MFDLGSAAAQLSRLVSGVRDDQLGRPTPCPEWTVAELLAHIHQFSTVFTDNARKRPVQPPDGLVADWRVQLPQQLDALVDAWGEDSAWRGRVTAGGIEMDAADNAVVAIEELTTHGWDLARATGQEFDVDDATLDQLDRFFTLFSPEDGTGDGPFGPVAPAPESATRLQRTIARTGRDPVWPKEG